MKRSIVLLGGHLSPAQAVAEYIKEHYQDVSIYFIGRKTAFSVQTQSTEEKVMSRYGQVLLIDAPRNIYPWNIPKLFFAFLHVFLFLYRLKPTTIVSFGSYVAFPSVLAAILLRIRLVIHEQTRSLSTMNRFSAAFSDAICVNDEHVVVPRGYNAKKVITGFPLRPSLFESTLSAAFPIPIDQPLIVIMGGTTGAVSLNKLLFPIIPQLVSAYAVVHITGDISYEEACKLKAQLPKDYERNYVVETFCSAETMQWLYKQMSLAVTRSGANTVYELVAFQIPAIFVPLPWSKEQEQLKLAQWAVQKTTGLVVDQYKIDSFKMAEYIHQYINKSISHHVPVLDTVLSGTRLLVQQIITS